MSSMTAVQRDKLVTDLKNVIQDAEDLLKLTASEVGAEASALRARVGKRLVQARASLQQLQAAATQHAKLAARRADSYAHDHPWPAIGVAALLGLVAGLALGRR